MTSHDRKVTPVELTGSARKECNVIKYVVGVDTKVLKREMEVRRGQVQRIGAGKHDFRVLFSSKSG